MAEVSNLEKRLKRYRKKLEPPRTETITIRVTVDEKHVLRMLARKYGVRIGDIIRVYIKPLLDDAMTLEELSGEMNEDND